MQNGVERGGVLGLIGDIGPEVGDVYSPMVTGRLKSPLHVGRCIPGDDLGSLVGMAPGGLGITHHLLQLLVEI